MSKYTTELRFYLEALAGEEESKPYKDVADIIAKTRPLVFSFDYPVSEFANKEDLETKILYHYYTREIGFESIGLWKLKLQTRMQEIMPYYNKLYDALADKFELFKSNSQYIEREHSGENASDRTGTNTNTTNVLESSTNEVDTTNKNDNTNKFLDTPQGGLNGIIDSDYLTNVTIDDGSSSQNLTGSNSLESNGTTNGKTTDKYNASDYHKEFEHHYGYHNQYDDFDRYEQEKFNIDMRVIDELETLFLHLW